MVVIFNFFEQTFVFNTLFKKRLLVKKQLFLATMINFYFMSFPALANKPALSESHQFQVKVAEFAQTLNLTGEQSGEILEIIKLTKKKRDRILKKYRISLESQRKVRLNIRDKMALFSDMKKIKDSQEYKLSQILNESQMSLWQSFTQESQEAFKQRLLSIIG